MATALTPRDSNAGAVKTTETISLAEKPSEGRESGRGKRRVSFKTMDDLSRLEADAGAGTPSGGKTVSRGTVRAATTRLAQLKAARAAAAAAAAAGGKPAGAFEPTTSRRAQLKLRRGTGRAVHARPFVIRVNLPGIMKQKSSSDMSVSSESGPRAGAMASGVSIVEIGEDSRASAGSGSGSRGSNANPFSVNVGTFDGPRPMFRPSTAVPARAAAGMETPNGTKPKSGRPSAAGTPHAAEALAMMMNAEYPEGLPEETRGVSHFGASQRDEPPLMDFDGEMDMDVGYDDALNDWNDEFQEPPAPRKRTTAGVPHKRLRAEMERRKSLALAGLQANERGLRRSTRQRSKPLEYWRGETKVYQRVHSSLPTVTQIERRSANPVWPRKTPGGPSQPFRVSRLRPAEILRQIGGELPDPSPLDRRGVRYGLVSPAPYAEDATAAWAEKYGINPLSTRVNDAPGRGVPLMRDEDEPAAKKRKKRGRKPKAVKEAEERAANEALVSLTVAEIIGNVIAANDETPEPEVSERGDVVEAEIVVEAVKAPPATEEANDAPTPEESDDESDREAEREADEALAEIERELAAEAAAEAEALEAKETDRVVVEDVPEPVAETAANEDAVELNVEFSRADTSETTTSEAAEEATAREDAAAEEKEEEAAVVEAAAEDDQPEASPLANVDINVDDDPMDVDVPVSAAKPVVRDEDEAAANDEN